ncbi:MAG TPA: transglycosylase family protein [Solirubrobacteraceae bacterium]|nr:transglycosylase family protein [Solirubrobacteraceae bacterium]
MSFRRRRPIPHTIAATALAVVVALAAAPAGELQSAGASSIGQLNSQLGAQQAHQQSLSASLSRLAGLISALDGQISLVQSREATVRAELAQDRAALAKAQVALAKERALVAMLRGRLARARMLLSRQLVSSYEGDRPDLVTVVLDANGFTDLLEKLDFLHRAEQQQQTIISVTRAAKAQADSAAKQLARLEASDREMTQAATVHAQALAGMNALLQSRQAALAQARAAQQAALAASRATANRLQSQINRLKAEQAAAAAARAAASATIPTAAGPALGPSGGWVIPYAIVLCESGGQNLPPNSAGASGYYQIIPSTWKLFGGTGPAAYLASKSEQDAVASRIWNGGAGASNWVCAGIVGIH